MKVTIIFGLIFMSINLFGQRDSYYWYKDEKIPLRLEEHKEFML